jgi:hypothetical protein
MNVALQSFLKKLLRGAFITILVALAAGIPVIQSSLAASALHMDPLMAAAVGLIITVLGAALSAIEKTINKPVPPDPVTPPPPPGA